MARIVNRRSGRRQLRRRLRDFLLAGAVVPPGARVRAWELAPAVAAYLSVGRRFRRHGLQAAVAALPRVSGARRSLDAADPATVFCARAAAVQVLGVVRTVDGRHLCLHESLGVAAALRRLGFPARVVVGYPVIEAATGVDELHAWPQLGEATVTDRVGSRPLNFVELIRYP